jgi:hypothetical protein
VLTPLKFRAAFRTTQLGAGLLAFAAGISCDNLVDPPLPSGATQFSAPAVYTRWWAMVEQCSGLSGSLNAVHWYSTPEQLWNPNNSTDPVEGYWSLASNRVVLNSNDTIDGPTVRHEMLHALTRSGAHSRSAFLKGCGGVVSCPTRCVQDAGAPPSPDPSAPTVPASELEVTTAISPASPSFETDGGLGTFTISVHNAASHAVMVMLPAAPPGGIMTSFGYDLSGDSGGNVAAGEPVLDVAVTYFAAGETKRDVVDFLVAHVPTPSTGAIPGIGIYGIVLPPDHYLFRGNYGGHAAADLSVTLIP